MIWSNRRNKKYRSTAYLLEVRLSYYILFRNWFASIISPKSENILEVFGLNIAHKKFIRINSFLRSRKVAGKRKFCIPWKQKQKPYLHVK